MAALEKVQGKRITATHRDHLAIWLAYNQRTSEKFKGCGGIYSAPFSRGHLRITATAADSLKQCQFQFASSVDRATWVATPHPRKRERQEPALNGGASCEKSDS